MHYRAAWHDDLPDCRLGCAAERSLNLGGLKDAGFVQKLTDACSRIKRKQRKRKRVNGLGKNTTINIK